MILDKRVIDAMACVCGPEHDEIGIGVLNLANMIIKQLNGDFEIEFNDINNCFHITGNMPEISRKIGIHYCGEPVLHTGYLRPHPAPLAVFITDTSNDDNIAIVEISIPDTLYWEDAVRIINGYYPLMKSDIIDEDDVDLDEIGMSCEITTNRDIACNGVSNIKEAQS